MKSFLIPKRYLLLLISVVSGCSSNSHRYQNDSNTILVTYDSRTNNSASKRLADALDAYEQKKYSETIILLEDILFSYRSRDNQFERKALTLIAYSNLKSGDIYSFRQTMSQLKPLLDRRRAFSKDMQYLLIIDSQSGSEQSVSLINKKGFRIDKAFEKTITQLVNYNG